MKATRRRRTLRTAILTALAVAVLSCAAVFLSANAAGTETVSGSDSGCETVVVSSRQIRDTSHQLFKPNAVYNGSFRSELIEDELPVYDALYEEFVTNQSNGTVTVDFTSMNYTTSDRAKVGDMVLSAYAAFTTDHPEVYWISGYSLSTWSSGDAIIKVEITAVERYSGDYDQLATVQSGISSAVSSIRSLRASDSRYDTVLAIHDYICNTMTYDYDAASSGAYGEAHCCAPLFGGGSRGHQFVCEGYANAFKLLCDKFGIPAVHVKGNAGGPHSWNYVRMEDGCWYGMDCTWDDGSPIDYTYFLIGKNTRVYNNKTFAQDHVPDNQVMSSDTQNPLAYPVLADSAYVPAPDLGEPVDVGTDFYAIISHSGSGRNLTNDSTNVSLRSDTDRPDQVWKFERQSDLSYKITSMLDLNCLEVSGSSVAADANIRVFISNGGDAQRWFFYGDNGRYRLKAACSDCVLDLAGGRTDDGTNVQTGVAAQSSSQLFTLIVLDDFKETANIGSEAYGQLFMSGSDRAVTNDGTSAAVTVTGYAAEQLLKFRRNPDGSYSVISGKDGRFLTVNGFDGSDGASVGFLEDDGKEDQKWFLHRDGSSYSLSPVCAGLYNTHVLTVDGNSLVVTSWDDLPAQKFVFEASTGNLNATSLSVSSGTSESVSAFDWSSVPFCDHYNLVLWNGKAGEGQPIYTSWDLTGTSLEKTLAAGCYEGYVEASNYFTYSRSNTVSFTVLPVVSVSTANYSGYTFTWNPVLSAASYGLTVYPQSSGTAVAQADVGKAVTSCTFTLEPGQYRAVLTAFFDPAIAVSGGGAAISSMVADPLAFTADPAVPATSVSLDRSTALLTVGSSLNLSATVSPSGSTDSVVWTSSNSGVATVSSVGTVKAVRKGTAVITAKAGNVTATCTVTVTPADPGGYPVTLSKTEMTLVITNTSPSPYASVTAKKPRDIKKVVWYSDNPSVATVNQSGRVTAVSVGLANICCKSETGEILSAPCVVSVGSFVIECADDSILFTNNAYWMPYKAGGALTISGGVIPMPDGKDITAESPVWKSSNAGTVRITPDGYISGTGRKGAVTVTVTGGKFFKTSIKVNAYQPTDSLTVRSVENVYVGKTVTIKPVQSKGANEPVLWSSSDNSVATVTPAGVVRGISQGRVIITARTPSGHSRNVSVYVRTKATALDWGTVPEGMKPRSSVKLGITVGERKALYAVITSPAGSNDKITWTVGGKGIVEVVNSDTSNGTGNTACLYIRGLKKGTSTITARTGSGKKITYQVTVVTNPADSITLTRNYASLYVGASVSFPAKTAPKGNNDVVMWYSTDTNVARVDETGKVTAVGQGEAYIVAYSGQNENAYDVGYVYVRTKATGFTWTTLPDDMNPTSTVKYGIGVGESKDLCGVITSPADCNDTVTWTTSNRNVVAITNVYHESLIAGVKVQGLKKGTATITGKTGSGKKITYQITVVPEAAGSITLNRSEGTLYTGASLTLKATVLPKGCNDVVMWKSSDTSVATVNESGKVTGRANGIAVITAYSSIDGEVCAEFNVRVITKATSISLDSATAELHPGQTFNVYATLTPAGCGDTVTWKTSNKGIATVDENGVITAVKAGTCTVTARTGSGKTRSIKVKVTNWS